MKRASGSQMLFQINGKIVPEAEARVPVTDRGFLYGDGVFETLHAYGRTPFLLDEHLARMQKGFSALGFERAPDRRTLARWVRSAVEAAGFPEANVRVTVTRGSGPRGPSIRGPYRPFTALTAARYRRRPERDYTRGVTAIMSRIRRQEARASAGLKTSAYMEELFARREADQAGVDEALLLNNAGLLCEGSASNITLVRDGVLIVPDPERTGALPGTMQRKVLELARALKIPVRRTVLGPWDLRECGEAFLSGSLREITPLVRVDGRPLGDGRPGPLTRRLIAAYRALVEKRCAGYRFPAS